MARNDDDMDVLETIEVDDSVIAKEKNQKLIRLPLSRIKQIIKMDPEVTLAGSEAVFLIAKATELFLQEFAKNCGRFATQGKRKTLKRQDIDSAIDYHDAYAFLEGALETLE
ncbi:DgyrCDS7906 [Dimorphilus gyrociliatus]|uniref:DgyrCDS7906 n=1 Tax=Dimorphilus gyrociliatus TaxID=2664684 RepID=A0A7I8VU80_9ANNE|nr:DgyrCDS7906 [Dimorphilus gyrociliatus]